MSSDSYLNHNQSVDHELAMKRKLDREELRKREFDRKLEREMRAIESVLTTKYQSARGKQVPRSQGMDALAH